MVLIDQRLLLNNYLLMFGVEILFQGLLGVEVAPVKGKVLVSDTL